MHLGAWVCTTLPVRRLVHANAPSPSWESWAECEAGVPSCTQCATVVLSPVDRVGSMSGSRDRSMTRALFLLHCAGTIISCCKLLRRAASALRTTPRSSRTPFSWPVGLVASLLGAQRVAPVGAVSTAHHEARAPNCVQPLFADVLGRPLAVGWEAARVLMRTCMRACGLPLSCRACKC